MRPISWSPPSTRPGRAAHQPNVTPDGSHWLCSCCAYVCARPTATPRPLLPRFAVGVLGCLHVTPATSLALLNRSMGGMRATCALGTAHRPAGRAPSTAWPRLRPPGGRHPLAPGAATHADGD